MRRHDTGGMAQARSHPSRLSGEGRNPGVGGRGRRRKQAPNPKTTGTQGWGGAWTEAQAGPQPQDDRNPGVGWGGVGSRFRGSDGSYARFCTYPIGQTVLDILGDWY